MEHSLQETEVSAEVAVATQIIPVQAVEVVIPVAQAAIVIQIMRPVVEEVCTCILVR